MRIDENGDGQVDYASFVAAGMNHHILTSKQNIRSAFDAIANDGFITTRELIVNFQLAKPLDVEIEAQGDEETINVQEEQHVSQAEQAEDEAKWQRIIGELGLGDRDTIDYESFEKIMLKSADNKQD